MFSKVCHAFFECFDIFRSKLRFSQSAVHFESADCCHDNDCIRSEACKAAFDVEEFFSTEVSTEACFSYGIISHFQSVFCSHYAVAAVSDIGKRTAVNEGRRTFERLYEIRFDCIFE